MTGFRLHFYSDEIDEILDKVRIALSSGQLSLGPYANQLERAFAELIGVPYTVSANSGFSALEIILRYYDTAGKEVLVPANTNYATAASVLAAGATVTFYDSGLYPSIESIKSRLTGSTAAIVVVHVAGYISPDVWAIRDICKARGIPLIEDAAHAFGAALDGVAAGGIGDAAAFSLFPSKVVTTGEGGMVVTSDEQLSIVARQLRNHGKRLGSEVSERIGGSWRMTELGAAIGLVQLKRFSIDLQRRNAISAMYRCELGAVEGICFPEPVAEQILSGYKTVAILDGRTDRVALKKSLATRGVEIEKEVYGAPLYNHPVFERYADGTPLERAEYFTRHHICLPNWRHMTDADVRSVARAVRASLNS
ncbi:DegT/DnrJ/EryC1/StrS family aminotransferase [Streptomyces sp. NPDC051677]|uniref:DegT/DnrJ/EryC1/StrS family aminotransferase n=1 Tax=Streptomyces sp. NPDC051677 TaxID=3365669 RepID=UPI0037D6955F